jgi:hypothetical protein
MERLILFFLMACSFYMNAHRHNLTLQRALAMNLVKAKAFSLGAYQGFCMRMEIKNIGKDSIIVTLEAGRRLNSLNNSEQDILIVKEEIIALKEGEEKKLDIKGYCCQASNRCPSVNSKYSVNDMADSNLVKLARFLSKSGFEKDIEQQAIWAISDNKSTAGITALTDTLSLPLRYLVAGLKGEKLPWYTLVSCTYMYPGGFISTTPLRLRGKMSYSNDKENYVTCMVLNEKGVPVCQVKSQWLKACVNENYNLDVPVKGLAKGKYTIELRTMEKQLARQEFEI